MEVGEANSSSLKRARTPLSDTEGNIVPPTEVNDGQKRRRLDVAGQENCSPKVSSSGRLAELKKRQDTPIVPSVRSRLEQLTQKHTGGAPLAQRCLSDPGTDNKQDKVFRECLLGEEQFHQRVECFEALISKTEASPTPSPVSSQNRSDFVSGIQQKLQDTATPSSKQASRIRQEREQELNQLQFQPISENAWLKRSSSDPSLSQADDDIKLNDGSFTEPSAADKPAVDTTDKLTGGRKQCVEEDASTPVESSHKVQLLLEWNEINKDRKHEEVFLQPEARTVLQLSFSEEVNESLQSVAEDQRCVESPHPEEEVSDMKTDEKSSRTDENDKMADSSHGEDIFEPSTDDELRSWRYPHGRDATGEDLLSNEQDDCVVEQQRESEPSREDMTCNEDLPEQCQTQSDQTVTEDPLPKGEELDSELQVPLEFKSSQDGNTSPRDGDVPRDGSHVMKLDERAGDGKHVESQSTDAEMESSICMEHIREDACESEALSVDANHEEEDEANTESGVLDDEADEGKDEYQTEETHKTVEGESCKRVTLVLEPELIKYSILSDTTSLESVGDTSMSDVELSFHDETNTAEIIDQMFDEVLEYAGKMQESRADEEDTEDHDSGIRTCMTEKEKMETNERKDAGEVGDGDEEQEESELLESNADELLTFPPSCILSPLSKSVEAAVTPLRLAAGLDSNPPSLLLTPEETSTPMAESAPLYSVDAYRTLHQSKPPTIQSATPSAPRRAAEKSSAQPSVNSKEKIAALNGEAAKLQNVINQTLQALSCCTDEEHGRGSLEEAEAEKLLLVSCEKRAALLAEVARLRDERNSESVAGSKAVIQQQPCRGTVTITNIQLPLKVEFVCSSHSRPGRPSHYFFILIRYGPCNIVATPLATAADAQNGDTISFPTSVTLKDIRSTFEIDVEVYSLSHTSASSCTTDRASIRSRVTPRKLLNTLTQSNNSMGSTGLSRLTRRSSDFSLVGSHKITLASLGHSKFPLDKMKLEGKIRRLLGDEFQEKVPFLSPLEGSIYLKLDSQGHSHVQHQGFLTMFEMISGFGMWHRRYFALDGCTLLYWNHPNDQEDKEPVGRVSLSSSSTECVRPVNRDLCARPFTFELVRSPPQQQQQQGAMTKCWFSADTKEERLDWIEKVNQALLDFRTWSRVSASQTETQQTAKSRESLL
ncbi:anillin, actin binding protein 2 isoform 2-T2 [Synchiropus picturatus]